jgi:hypothetical protein
MQRNHLLQEDCFGSGDVLKGLPRHRLRHETDKVTGVTCLERHAELTVRLEATDAGAIARARIDYDKWSPRGIDLDALGGNDARQKIVRGPCERAPIEHQLGCVAKDVRDFRGAILVILISALP